MKKTVLTLLICAFVMPVFAQLGQPGAPGSCNPAARTGDPAPTPLDGDGTLGQVYNKSLCGLNYVSGSTKLGQRYSPPGPGQPAPISISGIPCNGTAAIDKAYLWVGTSGNGVAITANIVDPLGSSHSFPMTLVGSDQDKCWGYTGTHTYRADVTSAITGNGNYLISNIPTGTGNDADGATLVIIYRDPTATWEGTLVIHDGTVVINGGTTTQTINNFNVCGPTQNASGFMCVADLQGLGAQMSINSGPNFGVVEDWWNYMQQPTTVSVGQTTASYTVNSSSDCFNFCVMGLYYQTTTCVTCVPTAQTLNITPTVTPPSCNQSNGAASVSVTGGSGQYSYSWVPSVSSSNSATNLSAGVYTVVVMDTTPCVLGSVTVVLPNNSTMSSTQQVTNVTCNGGNDGAASVTVTGGTGPYTYSWAPTGGNGSSASNLTANTYTVTVTDAQGCVLPILVPVQQPSAAPVMPVISPANPTMCADGAATLSVATTGGNGQYTYSWSNGAGTNQTVTVSPPANTEYVVTVSDGCGNSGTDTVQVAILPLPIISVSVSEYWFCAPNCITFTNSVVPPNGSFYWDFGDGNTSTDINPTHCYTQPGTYSFSLGIDDGTCNDTGYVFNQIVAIPGPQASFTIPTSYISLATQPVTFTNTSTNAVAYQWDFGDSTYSTLANPSHTFPDTGTYCITLIADNGSGCIDTTVQCYKVLDDLVIIPNIFTPGSDGKNDVFFIQGVYGSGHQLAVFSRWGDKVYESSDYQNDWNGANVSDGVYYYVFTHNTGKTYSGFVHVLKNK